MTLGVNVWRQMWPGITGGPPGGSPAGAFAEYVEGLSLAVPVLRLPTTPGNLLLVMVSVQATAAVHAAGATLSAPGGGGPAWTAHAFESAWATGSRIGPPGAIGFGIYSRVVAPGEVTTTPVQVTPGDAAGSCSVWLWEIPNGGVQPTLATSSQDLSTVNGADFTVGSSLAGWVVGGSVLAQVDYGGQPTATAVSGTVVSNVDGANAPPRGNCSIHWTLPWTWLGQLPAGGTLKVNWNNTCYDPIHAAAVGAAVVVPGLSKPLPTIPYPANQT